MGGFPDLIGLALCYCFRDTPKEYFGALAYGITRHYVYFKNQIMSPILSYQVVGTFLVKFSNKLRRLTVNN